MDTMQRDLQLTTADVASDLGLHPGTVRRLLQWGDLRGLKLSARQWRVSRAELERFRASGHVRRQGRPRKDGRER